MKAKKIISLLVTSAVLLCGCSNGSEPASTDTGSTTTAQAPQNSAENTQENTEKNTESEAANVNQVNIRGRSSGRSPPT